MSDYENHRQIIDALGGYDEVAGFLGLSVFGPKRHWKLRNIPLRFWPDILSWDRAIGLGITLAVMRAAYRPTRGSWYPERRNSET